MKLIADAGSTKVEWILFGANIIVDDHSHITESEYESNVAPIKDSSVVKKFKTAGINPITMTAEEIRDIIYNNVYDELHHHAELIVDVHYFGAGCRGGKFNNMISDALKEILPNASIEVDSDMVGAAKALFGNNCGIACILGTGSNSCLFDGIKIVDQIPSLGFILGDEGSGSYLGKQLLGSIMKRQLPEEIIEKFEAKYHLTVDDIILKVYKGNAPNKFLASFVPFIIENIANLAIRKMVRDSFSVFFVRNILPYRDAEKLPIGFIGSVAYYLKDILCESASANNLSISKILASPTEGLIEHYSSLIN